VRLKQTAPPGSPPRRSVGGGRVCARRRDVIRRRQPWPTRRWLPADHILTWDAVSTVSRPGRNRQAVAGVGVARSTSCRSRTCRSDCQILHDQLPDASIDKRQCNQETSGVRMKSARAVRPAKSSRLPGQAKNHRRFAGVLQNPVDTERV
jgi:hypothetical protein